MPSPLFNITPLLESIHNGALILTPNNRLKNKVLSAYHHWQQQQGTKVWASPKIFSLQDWLNLTYQTLVDELTIEEPKQLASALTRQRLWLEIISQSESGTDLINPIKLASDADNAFKTLLLWNLKPEDNDTKNLFESQDLFFTWVEIFSKKLEENKLHSSEQKQHSINRIYRKNTVNKEPKLLLVGFEDIPPLTKETFELIADSVENINSFSPVNSKAIRKSLTDFNDEIKAAAHWSQEIISQDPHVSIGIIVPNLGQCRAQIERVFVEVFEPHFLLPEVSRYTLPFNFSAGIPLGQTAIIHDAISLLKLNQYSLDTESIIRLLNSPFWGAPQLSQRQIFLCELTQLIKRQLRPTLKTSKVRQLAHKLAQQHITALNSEQNNTDTLSFGEWFSQCLQDLESLRRRCPHRQSANQWADHFVEQLNIVGWPGERRPDSSEYQQMQQWFSLLETFTELDQLPQTLSQQEALEQLVQLASAQHFQAQTPDSPIQILGALEGSGLTFTHCWVLGMNQQDWPAIPQPNPLLPLELQRKMGMPHADAERELVYAQRLTEGYKQSARDVIFSYSKQRDGAPLQPSALIEDLPLAEDTSRLPNTLTDDLAQYFSTLSTGQMINGQPPLEWVNCSKAPQLTDFEKTHIRGGSSIFRNQAICPFTAFAIHRLGASQPLEPTQGLSPITRGEILHNVLERIWSELRNQETLISTDHAALLKLVNGHITSELLRCQQREPDLLGTQYLELELQRQSRLIMQWLELEKSRPDFSVVSCEELIKVEFNGLPLSLRLDRLDRLSSGELIVIDYKTGSPSIKKWEGTRPEEPQLPLYALLYSADIHALMFAEINAKNIAIKGLGHLSQPHEGIIPATDNGKLDLPNDWENICDHWHGVLAQLSENFINGDCSLSFKSKSLALYYTDLYALMRTAEQATLIEDFKQHSGLSV